MTAIKSRFLQSNFVDTSVLRGWAPIFPSLSFALLVALVLLALPGQARAVQCLTLGNDCEPRSKHKLSQATYMDTSFNNFTEYEIPSGGLDGLACRAAAGYGAWHNVYVAPGATAPGALLSCRMELPAASTGLFGVAAVYENIASTWYMVTPACTDALNGNLARMGDDMQCYCPRGWDWSDSKHACVIAIDRFWPPDVSPFCVGNPIHPLKGSKSQTEDLGVSVGKDTLKIIYDSSRKVPAAPGAPLVNGAVASRVEAAKSFGELWHSNIHKSLVIQRKPGTGWTSGEAFYLQASRGADGAWLTFKHPDNATYVAQSPKALERMEPGPDANKIRLIDAQGNVETYDAHDMGSSSRADLISIDYVGGGRVSYSYSDANTPASVAPVAGLLIGAQDDQGRTVQLRYDAFSRITQLTSAEGRVTSFEYDSNNNLVKINLPDGKFKQYLYERTDLPWALTGVVDENESRLSTFTYDADGRAIGTQYVGGVDSFSVTYTVPGYASVVETWDPDAGNILWRDHYEIRPQGIVITLSNGATTTLDATTVAGATALAGQTQAAGSGCAASNKAFTYDSVGNVLSQDDFQGNRSCFAYDAKNRMTLQVDGLANTMDCAHATDYAATLPSGVRKTATIWHPDWRLQTQVKRTGGDTTKVYHGQPDPFNGNTIANCSSAANLPNGKPLPLICKTVEVATTDVLTNPATGDLDADSVSLLMHGDGLNASTSFVDSSPSPKTFTVVGAAKLSTAQSKFGGSSLYFDGQGARIVSPKSSGYDFDGDFTIEFWAWKSGPGDTSWDYLLQCAWVVSPSNGWTLGLRTTFSFNHRGADGVGDYIDAPVSIYDSTWHHYAVSRAAGVLRLFVDGVQVAQRTTSANFHTYDSDLIIGASDNGNYGFAGYVDDLRITKGVGRYTADFTPSAQPFAGHYVSHPDPATPVRTTTYTYNALGKVLTVTDPNNRVTTYSYYSDTAFTGADPDAIGHTVGDLQSITNPAGHITSFTQYDKAGRVRQSVDAKGITTDTTYTPRGWVSSTAITPPGGVARSTGYSYDATGQLKVVTQPDGSTVTYSYDAAHRLIGIKDAHGNEVAYTLDNAGNRTAEQIKDPAGVLQRSISRSFDALNRLQQVSGAAR